MDFYTNVTVVALIVTAIGVFLGPLFAERNKKINERRNSHFNKIKDDCLKPVIGSIDNLLWDHFTISENPYNYEGILQHKEFLSKGITDIKLWYSLIGHASTGDHALNQLLYDDLQIHFSKLKESIDDAQKFLNEKCHDYEMKRIELVIKLFVMLGPKIKSMSEQNQAKIERAVSVALLCIFDYDKSFWPNYYIAASSDGTLKIVQEAIDNNEEIKNLGNEVKEIHDKSKSKLLQLRSELGKLIEYEGELKGKCSYI